MIAIIDYNIGNISAVVNMLQRLGVQCKIATCSEDVVLADKIILPGNGAFDACMNNLRLSGLIPVLEHQVLQLGRPLLGICVGAQMLGYSSEEGCEPGLGWLIIFLGLSLEAHCRAICTNAFPYRIFIFLTKEDPITDFA